MLYQEVCYTHGGASPQARRKAQERAEAHVDELMWMLIQIAQDEKQPGSVRLTAIKDALDRAGFGASKKVDVAVRKFEEDFGSLLIDLEVEDAEVIEDMPPALAPAEAIYEPPITVQKRRRP